MNESTNLFQVINSVNVESGGVLFTLILLVLFIVTFVALKNYHTSVVFITSSFITTIIAVLFYFAGLISWTILIIPIVLLFGSIVVKWITTE